MATEATPYGRSMSGLAGRQPSLGVADARIPELARPAGRSAIIDAVTDGAPDAPERRALFPDAF